MFFKSQSKLIVGDKQIFINVKDFKIEDGSIRGYFQADNASNTITVLTQNLKYPKNKIYKIFHNNEFYEIIIVDVIWDFVDNSLIVYICDFFGNIPLQNKVLWDAGDDNPNLSNFLNEDASVLEEEANHLIEKFRYYYPSSEFPTPSVHGRYAYDLAAILSETKPAAIVPENLLDSLSWLLLLKIIKKNLKLSFIERKDKRFAVVGSHYNVYEIIKVLEKDDVDLNKVFKYTGYYID